MIINFFVCYDVEGMIGIINIVLCKEIKGGFNGFFDVNIGNSYNYGVVVNFNY